jgi:hypothetical protein
MENRENSDRLYPVDLVIEGNEDTSVIPWKGPRPGGAKSAGVIPAGLSREPVHVLIANDEDLEVRPRRRVVVAPLEDGKGFRST